MHRLAVILLAFGCAGAQTPSASSASSASAVLDSTLAKIFSLDLAPGMSIAVVRDTQVIYAKGFGWADVEARRPVTPQTIFYIASTTKSFTGLAAAMLAEQGRLDLDAPLTRYLPTAKLQAPLNPDSITLRALLSHTHGIDNDGPDRLSHRLQRRADERAAPRAARRSSGGQNGTRRTCTATSATTLRRSPWTSRSARAGGMSSSG